MDINGQSIYGTRAGPFRTLAWGRCTRKPIDGKRTRLYLHVFDWPADGTLVLPGLSNEPRRAALITGGSPLPVARKDDALVIQLPARAPDPVDTVVVLDIEGRPDVHHPPTIAAPCDIFVDTLDVAVTSERENVQLRYTTDATPPTVDSPPVTGPIRLTDTTTLHARAFQAGRPVSGIAQATFTKVTPRPAADVRGLVPGLHYEYFEGEWDRLPDFDRLTPVVSGTLPNIAFTPRRRPERFGFRYTGYIQVPRAGIYTFYTRSDDGSRLYIGDELVVDNDGLHVVSEKQGVVALAAGPHPLTVTFFERTGDDGLEVSYAGPGIEKQRVPDHVLRHRPQATPR
jgi:hypothetical protein